MLQRGVKSGAGPDLVLAEPPRSHLCSLHRHKLSHRSALPCPNVCRCIVTGQTRAGRMSEGMSGPLCAERWRKALMTFSLDKINREIVKPSKYDRKRQILIEHEATQAGSSKEKTRTRSDSLGTEHFKGTEDSANETKRKEHEYENAHLQWCTT